MTDHTDLIARLPELRSKSTPELSGISVRTLAELLRLGAANQVPRADNWDAPDFEADARYIVALLQAADALEAATPSEREVEEQRDDLFDALAGVLFADPGPKLVAAHRHARGLWTMIDAKFRTALAEQGEKKSHG